MKKSIPWFSAAILGFLVIWLLESVGIQILTQASQGGEPTIFERFYPSLPMKIQQVGLAQLLDYLFSIKFRWLVLVGFSWYLFSGNGSRLVERPDFKSLYWRVRLFFGIQLLYLPDLLNEITLRHQWKAFYTPLPLFSAVLPHFPSIWLLQFVVVFAFGVSAFFILSKWSPNEKLPAWMALAGLILWTILLAVFFGFGKIDHTYASMYSGYLFMVVWLFYWNPGENDGAYGFRIFQAGIWGCYFFSGLEKIFLSGFHWVESTHFENLCWLHPAPLCAWIGQVPVLPGILLSLVLVFQLASALQWRYPSWGYVNVVGGLLFHLGIWLVLDVGGWQSPWIPMLIFLWPIRTKEPNPRNEVG